MALSTSTLLALEQSFSESIGDFLEFDTTTNITTNTSVISTTLKQYDEGEDDHFGGADTEWWLYITEGNNSGVERRVSDYATSSGTLTVYGAALAAETGAVTCRLGRYRRTHKKNAIIEAVKEIYPSLHLSLDNRTLITGNILPDASFESWSSATALNWFTAGSATLAETTTDGLYRGQKGSTSAKVTAGAASDYIEIDSDTYPRLLDLMNRTVNFYTWAYPETADDPSIQIYTLKADSTAQTLTSSTSAPAAKWTKLELEDQSLNDDLVYVRIRWIVATNGQYCYFDDAYLNGMSLSEYLLPDDFYGGHLNSVQIHTSGYSDEIAYDINPFQTGSYVAEPAFDIISDGIYLWLKLFDGRGFPYAPPDERRLRLLGHKPLETLSADADTITIDTERVPLLMARARMIFWEREMVPISTTDKGRAEREYARAERNYRRLLNTHRMPVPAERRRG